MILPPQPKRANPVDQLLLEPAFYALPLALARSAPRFALF